MNVQALTDINHAHDSIRRLERENAHYLNRVLDLGKRVHDLTDEIIRLRRSMPVDALREYDRRQGRIEH